MRTTREGLVSLRERSSLAVFGFDLGTAVFGSFTVMPALWALGFTVMPALWALGFAVMPALWALGSSFMSSLWAFGSAFMLASGASTLAILSVLPRGRSVVDRYPLVYPLLYVVGRVAWRERSLPGAHWIIPPPVRVVAYPGRRPVV